MAIKSQLPAWWCILLHFLALFATTTLSELLSHDVDHNSLFVSNGTSTSRNLVTRDFETFADCFSRGCGLYQRLSNVDAEQTVFTTSGALSDNGWNWEDQQGIFSSDLEIVYDHLGISTSSDNNPLYYVVQDVAGATENAYGGELYPAGTRYGATLANYANRMNPQGGMLLCLANYGASYELARSQTTGAKGPVPPMNFLSDLLWFQWLAACEAAGTDKGNIKYILRHFILEQTTLAAIAGYTMMYPDQESLAWPGRTYSFTSDNAQEADIAKALLGTPSGTAVAMILVQHRADLGMKTVSKVQVYLNDQEFTNLLFYVEDA